MAEKRDPVERLRQLEEEDAKKQEERAKKRRAALDAALASGTEVTLRPDAIPSQHGWELANMDIMLGETPIGYFRLDEQVDTLFIAKIEIDVDMQRQGNGQRAMTLLARLAAKKYRCLAGEIEYGAPDVMKRRRRFCCKCGFSVDGDRVERQLT